MNVNRRSVDVVGGVKVVVMGVSRCVDVPLPFSVNVPSQYTVAGRVRCERVED